MRSLLKSWFDKPLPQNEFSLLSRFFTIRHSDPAPQGAKYLGDLLGPSAANDFMVVSIGEQWINPAVLEYHTRSL